MFRKTYLLPEKSDCSRIFVGGQDDGDDTPIFFQLVRLCLQPNNIFYGYQLQDYGLEDYGKQLHRPT